MNNVNAFPVSNNVLSFWNEIRNLGYKDKVELIALISSSLADDIKDIVESDKTKRMIACCGGAWKGNMSAEEIIKEINNKRSSSIPVDL
ncbi:MAG: hypothetical protein Q4F85_03910 [Prevotella sp.]|nr:hypothetical protein [Prevotella sp.]